MSQLILEAFQELQGLEDLEVATFPFDDKGAENLSRFLRNDAQQEESDYVDVADPDTDEEDNLQDNYEGEVILQCNTCLGCIVKNPREVIIDKATGMANVEEECPYCLNVGGYKVVAQIGPSYEEEILNNEDIVVTGDDEDVVIDTDNIEVEDLDKKKDQEDKEIINEHDSEEEDLEECLQETEKTEKTSQEVEKVYKKGWSKRGHSYKETGGVITTYVDGEIAEKYPSIEAAQEAGLKLEGVEEEIGECIKPLNEKREKKRDIWNELYGKLTRDGEQITKRGSSPRMNVGAGYENASDPFDTISYGVRTNAEGGIEVSANSEEELKPAIDITTAYIDMGVTYSVKRDKYRKGKPFVLSIRIPEELITDDGVDDVMKAEVAVAASEGLAHKNRKNESRGRRNPVRKALKESMEADIVLDKNKLIDYDQTTGDIVVSKSVYNTYRPGETLMIQFEGETGVQEYEITGETSTGIIMEYNSGRMNEDFSKVSMEAGDKSVEATADEDGKVHIDIDTKKEDGAADVEASESGESVLVPVSDEVMDEISNNSEGGDQAKEEEPEEEKSEEGAEDSDFITDEDVEGEAEESEEAKGEEPEEDVDIEDVDADQIDELGESYLKEVYDNVKSYKTLSGSTDGDKIKLEGLITFDSGKTAKTQFIFEANEVTKRGKYKFIGENKQIANSKKAFILTGNIKGKTLLPESLTYNYNAKDAKTGSTRRIYGSVRINNK